MSTDAPTPPPPPPPSGDAPPPGDPPPDDSGGGGDLAAQLDRLNRTLAGERRARTKAESALREMSEAQATDAEKATMLARNEGRLEGVRAAGMRLAAAEFKAAAAGKLADPSAAAELLDLSRFVDEDGEPDTDAITAAVERLAGALPVAPAKPKAPAVPNGAMAPGEDSDWLRAAIKTR